MASSDISLQPAQSTEDARFRLGYRRWLDGMRGIAVLLVLLFHFKILGGGWLGVDVFFVLSGFLITSLLVEEWENRSSISLKRFYLRRALRLLPAFYLLLLCCGLYAWLFLPSADLKQARNEILVAACYVADYPYLHNVYMPTLGHTWSLSIEEQFYLLWPLLLFIMLRLGASRRIVIGIVSAGILACMIHRMVLYGMYREPPAEKLKNIMRMYFGLDTRADALLTGCLVGLLASWNLLPKSKRFIRLLTINSCLSVILFSVLLVTRSMEHSQFYHGGFTLVAAMVATVLMRLLLAPAEWASKILESRFLVGVGQLSYALYLFHVPIIHWVKPTDLGWRYPGWTLLVCGLTFVAALVSYYCLERPCLRLKKRFENRARRTGPERQPLDQAVGRAA